MNNSSYRPDKCTLYYILNNSNIKRIDGSNNTRPPPPPPSPPPPTTVTSTTTTEAAAATTMLILTSTVMMKIKLKQMITIIEILLNVECTNLYVSG